MHWPLYLALRPGSRTVAEATVMLLVVASRCRLPEGGAACNPLESEVTAGRFREPRYEPQAVRPSPRTHGVPEGLCRFGPTRRLCRPHSRSSGLRCRRSDERCGSPRRSAGSVNGGRSTSFPKKAGVLASENACVFRERNTRKHEVHAASGLANPCRPHRPGQIDESPRQSSAR